MKGCAGDGGLPSRRRCRQAAADPADYTLAPAPGPWRRLFHSPWIHTMPRCAPQALPACIAPFVVAIALLAANLPTAAQTSRPFPANALRGDLLITQPPELLLNGRPARLSPGARIRGSNNMLQMSGALVGLPLLVHYTLEPSGGVHNVWVLTADEAARKPWPTTPEEAQRWVFNPAAQAWTKP